MLYPNLMTEVRTMDEQKRINILVTLDANYILPLRVLLHSLLRSDDESFFAVYVAHASLTAEDFARIAGALPESRFALYPVEVPPELLCDAPVLRRLTKASYYRLIAPSFLPDDVDRILYLDPDITVIRSLRPLYQTQLGAHYIAASGHFDGLIRAVNRRRLGMRHTADYVNSGVMLMDVRKLRALDNNAQIFDFVRRHARTLLLGDQDTVNAFYDGHILVTDAHKYNLDERTFRRLRRRGEIDQAWVRENTAIIHYAGSRKPWNLPYRGALGEYYEACRADLEKTIGEPL